MKRLHSPDIDDLKGYRPEESDSFGFLLQAMVGPAGGEGEESFDMVVCTPEWLRRRYAASEIILGLHLLIVFRYDYASLVSYIAKFSERCSGQSWKEVAQQLSRLGKWEFEDYQE
ncbi:MAG: immunity 8 family protein [Bryobacterales bacterium]|nr:immunity 8 family protein [Bryobacterales bacterium]